MDYTENYGSGKTSELSDAELEASVASDRHGYELRVGIFVILGLISFVTVFILLTDPATLRGRYRVVTTMTDAGGVRRGDPIQMRGVNIGRIDGFEMTPEGQVNVVLEVEGEWSIPEGSLARLGDSGLFGGRTMLIEPGASDRMLAEWDTIAGEGERESVFAMAESIGGQAGDVLSLVESLLDDSTRSSLQASASEMPELLSELRSAVAVQQGHLGRLTESLTRSAENLEAATDASPEITSAIARTDLLLAELETMSGTLSSAVTSLDGILARMDRGEGTLGRLSRDDSLYVNLSSMADAIAQLATAIRENPKDFVQLSIF